MQDIQKAGPILTEKDFFALLSENNPTTKAAKDAYARGAHAQARHLFAEAVRALTDIDKLFNLGGKPYAPTVSETLKREADDAMHNILSSCGEPYQFAEEVDWYFNPTYNKYSEWTWQLSRHHFLDILSIMYCATRDEKYAEKAIWYLHSWIRQATCPEDGTSPYATLCWRTIECGHRTQSWPEVLHRLMGSRALDDETICLIFRSMYETCHRLRIDHAKGTNWLVIEMTGLAKFSMIYPVFAESEEFLSYAVEKLTQAFFLQMHPDGFQYELTTEYHRVVVDQSMVVANLLERYGKRLDEKFYATVENALMLHLKLSQSGFTVPDLSDGREGPVRFFVRPHAYHFPENENLKFIMTDGKEGKITLPTSLLLENCGIVTGRDRWSPDAVSFLFDAGKLGGNHQHEDKLSLLVGAFGKLIVAEANRYAYDTSEIRKYSLGSASHNTVIIDGMGQNRKKNFRWAPEMLTSKEDVPVYFSDELDYARGIYNEGYGAEAEPLAIHERDVIFVKKPKLGCPYVIAIDTVSSDTERESTRIWHIDLKDTPTVKNGVVTFEQLQLFLAGDTDSIDIVKGQTEPTTQGFICRSTKQGDYEAIPTLLCTARGTKVKSATLIVPIKNKEYAIESFAFDGDMITVVYKNGQADTFSQSKLASLTE